MSEKSNGAAVGSTELLDCVCGTPALILFSRYRNEPLKYVGVCGNWNNQDEDACPTGGPDLEYCDSREQAANEWNNAIKKSNATDENLQKQEMN